jgi:hypothetical protein
MFTPNRSGAWTTTSAARSEWPPSARKASSPVTDPAERVGSDVLEDLAFLGGEQDSDRFRLDDARLGGS